MGRRDTHVRHVRRRSVRIDQLRSFSGDCREGAKLTRSIVQVSKFLSLILRHRPETIGVTLDGEGWLDIDTLIVNAGHHGRVLTRELIEEVVTTNDKQRFAISEDGQRIRANQGHSLRTVELDLTPIEPPETLFHGTVRKFLAPIRSGGLLKMSRNHVHLSADRETASQVGSRRGEPVILLIDSARMHADGHEFFLSENGVWLTEHVPPEYLRFP